MIVQCDHCGAELKRSPSDIRGKVFCDKKCMGLYRQSEDREFFCDTCGVLIIRRPSEQAAHNYCSAKCQGKGLTKYLSGEDSPHFTGATSDNFRARLSAEYKAWRHDVFERDAYTCQKCGEVGGSLEAHHKMAFARFPELRYDVDNGDTLCKGCHKEFHSIYGTQRFTSDDYYEWGIYENRHRDKTTPRSGGRRGFERLDSQGSGGAYEVIEGSHRHPNCQIPPGSVKRPG